MHMTCFLERNIPHILAAKTYSDSPSTIDTFVPECLECSFLSSIQDLLKLKYSLWLSNQDCVKIRLLSRQKMPIFEQVSIKRQPTTESRKTQNVGDSKIVSAWQLVRKEDEQGEHAGVSGKRNNYNLP